MVYTITDIRFMFRRNPFNSQQVHITPNQDASLNKLVKHIETHPQEFIAVNPITDIKYVNIVSPNDLKLLDGVKSPFKHKNIDEYSTISGNIKRFMLATGMNLSRDVKSWIGNFTPSMAIISPTVVVDEQTTDVVEIDADADGDDLVYTVHKESKAGDEILRGGVALTAASSAEANLASLALYFVTEGTDLANEFTDTITFSATVGATEE
jgi:hypothetical protein